MRALQIDLCHCRLWAAQKPCYIGVGCWTPGATPVFDRIDHRIARQAAGERNRDASQATSSRGRWSDAASFRPSGRTSIWVRCGCVPAAHRRTSELLHQLQQTLTRAVAGWSACSRPRKPEPAQPVAASHESATGSGIECAEVGFAGSMRPRVHVYLHCDGQPVLGKHDAPHGA
jgi:hypothetical protein